MRLKHRTAVLASAGAIAVAGVGAAIGFAAGGGGSHSQAFAEALSARVGTEITPEQIEQARLDVARERLAEAVKEGRLTQERADEMLERLAEAPERRAQRGELRGQRHEMRAAVDEAVAGFLGLSTDELHDERRQGNSPAEIAKAQGKQRSALLDVVKKSVQEGAKAAGIEAPGGEDLQELAERIVDGHGPGARGFRHGPGPRGPGGFGGFGPGGP